MEHEHVNPETQCPRATEQIRRALVLLDLATATENLDTQFILQVSALHLSRAIPEYWYTTADQISARLGKTATETKMLSAKLKSEFELVFRAARRYELVTDLRRWDFHWEPLINPKSIGPNGTFGRGAPMKLTTGPNANSSICYIGGANRVVATGSGRRVGRTNYYQIQKSRFVDFERSESVPLQLAIREFLDDLPACIEKIFEIPEVAQFVSEA